MIPESRELARPSLNFRTTCKFRTSKQTIQPEMPIVSCANRPSLRWLFTFVLVALAAAAVPAFAQEKKGEPSHSQGYVEDWSSHHVVFSNPGTEQEARKRGEYDKWLRIVNDERYMMQQRRRSSPRRWGGWGHDEASIQARLEHAAWNRNRSQRHGNSFSSEPDTASTSDHQGGSRILGAFGGGHRHRYHVLPIGNLAYTGSFTRSGTRPAPTRPTLSALINTAGCGNLVGVTATQGAGGHTTNFTITATGAGAGEIGTGTTDSIQLTSTTGTGTNFNLSTTWTNTALTGSTGINPNTYPAKYNQGYAGEAPSCSDYIVYPTGVTGSSSQAEVIGYTNLYKTTCTSNSGPTVAFAYNTGGATATLSPVISSDGKQIAYIQVSSGGVASLVLLRPSLTSGSTVTSPTLAASATAYYNSGAGCTAPCYYTIALSGNPNDTNSSPFYTYTSTVSDTLFVGDDSGKLHKFTPVFNGAPAEVDHNWSRPQPRPPRIRRTQKLTSPVYDGGGSGLVFVEDATGYLNSISARRHPRHRSKPRIRWSAGALDSSILPWWTHLPNTSTCLSVTAAPTELPLSIPATSTYLPPAPPSTQVMGTTTRSLTTKPPTTSAPFNTTACSITLTTRVRELPATSTPA